MATQEAVVKPDEIRRYMVDCMVAVGTCPEHAKALADVLVEADLRGHYSHGLNRLDMYVNDIKKKVCAASGTPTVKNDRPSTAWVEGNNLLGPVVGNFCMDLAVAKARNTGIGMVVAKGSNHYGIAGHYSIKAQRAGLIGMSFTNTSPVMVPTRAKRASVGTNPLTLAAPATGDDSFVLDMATTGVAIGKVEIEQRKGKSIPRGWAVDKDGKETTDPAQVIGVGGLYPLGGGEVTSGYKGYGLGMMVEIFCGMLSGGAYGPHVRKWMSTDREADLGQCFIAIDPAAFAPGFEQRMQTFMDEMRGLERAEGETNPVLVPGDPERIHIKLCEEKGGIPYHPNQISHAAELGKELNVKAPSTV